MILFFPIPGYVAKLVQETQKTKMKQASFFLLLGEFRSNLFPIEQTDARVQDVTEGLTTYL